MFNSLSTTRPVGDEITRDQLELLKAKFDVLQGERKAYFETYEQTKRTNEQLLKDLRDRQKELTRQLTEAQKKAHGRTGPGGKSSSSSSSSSSSKHANVSDDANVGEELIKRRTDYDKLRHKTADLRTEVERLQGELTAIMNLRGIVGAAAATRSTPNPSAANSRRGSEMSLIPPTIPSNTNPTTATTAANASSSSADDDDDTPSSANSNLNDTPLQRKVRQVENRLDKTAIKHEEALSIKRTYEQIVKRLKEERVSYDTQVAAIEKTISSKNVELEELKSLAGDATRAMEAAHIELARIRTLAANDREKRNRELRERQLMAQGRRHHAEVALARERARRDLLQEVAGDLGVNEEKALIQSVERTKSKKLALAEHSALIKRKLETYEAAWRRIKDTTGVADIGEVTAKMAGQVEQHQHLSGQSRENVNKLETLRNEIEAYKRFVEELRYTGGTGLGSSSIGPPSPLGRNNNSSPGRNETIRSPKTDTANDQILIPRGGPFSEIQSSLTGRMERAKEDSTAAALALVQVRLGVAHVSERVSLVRTSVGLEPLPPVNDTNIGEIIQQCSEVLDYVITSLDNYAELTNTDLLLLDDEDPEVATERRQQRIHRRQQQAQQQQQEQRLLENGGNDAPDTADNTSPTRIKPSTSSSSSSSRSRLTSPSETGATVNNQMSPSPTRLAKLGIADKDIVAVRPFNTRVTAAKPNSQNHHPREYRRRASVDYLNVGLETANNVDDAADEEDKLLHNGKLSDENTNTLGNENVTLSRDTIKRVAQRNADAHRRSNPHRAEDTTGTDGNNTSSGKVSGGGGGASGGNGKLRKMAGPPRHQY